MKTSTFELDQVVRIGGQVTGRVIGVTNYSETTDFPPNYYIRYTNPQTNLPVDDWFTGDVLTPF